MAKIQATRRGRAPAKNLRDDVTRAREQAVVEPVPPADPAGEVTVLPEVVELASPVGLAFEIRAADDLECLAIASLRRDPTLQCRAKGTHAATVVEYSAALKAGATFPPIVVFRNATGCWVGDGFHRIAGAEAAGRSEISAEVRVGGKKEALLFAASANSSHGLRRTTADKRRSIELLLAAFPHWSDRKLAAAAGVHHDMCGSVRKRVAESATPDAMAERDGDVAESATIALVERLSRAIAKLWAQCPEASLPALKAKLLDLTAAVEGAS